jgi:hypothetical protein
LQQNDFGNRRLADEWRDQGKLDPDNKKMIDSDQGSCAPLEATFNGYSGHGKTRILMSNLLIRP